jgi:hypothetical protein
MKKIFIIISILLLTSFLIANATENELSYSDKAQYDLYEERIKNICDRYQYINKDEKTNKIKFIKKSKSLIRYEKIPDDTSFNFDEIKENHRNNMNDIYKC